MATNSQSDNAPRPLIPLKGGFKMLPAAPGKCAVCAVAHDPAAPHNKQSLFYQMHFENEHGRAATWTDAMAHCTPEVQAQWTEALLAKGEKVPAAE